jgi:hypothetical protein
MKTTNKIIAGFAVLAVMAVGAGFAVNIEGALVNATAGFQFNGAAPSGHVLCGNGTAYVDSTTCGASANYQTMQSNGTSVTQRAALNFDSDFVLSDTLPATAVALASTISVTSANANAVGGVPLSGLCQSNGTTCPLGGTLNNVTSTRSFGEAIQNASAGVMFVQGFASTSGSGVGGLNCLVGPTTPSSTVWSMSFTATVSGGQAGFTCFVPAGYFYEITDTGAITGVTSWFELVL